MPTSHSYKNEALVLRKTKLGEKDLIVTLLLETGELKRAVAKGARRPGSSYAARLELFSSVKLVLSRGRNLDVITDAKLTQPDEPRIASLESSSCASAVAELLTYIAQDGLEQPRLYAMASRAFSCIAKSNPAVALRVTVAALMKIVSEAGYRPVFDRCQSCGTAIELDDEAEPHLFSISDGGATCSSCVRYSEGIRVSPRVLAWSHALLYSKFDDIEHMQIDDGTLFDILQITKSWIDFHIGYATKSIVFLMTSGLF